MLIRLLPTRRILVMTQSIVAVYDIPEPQSQPSVLYQDGTASTVPCWKMSYQTPPRYFSPEISPILPGDRSFHLTNGWMIYSIAMPDDGSSNFVIAHTRTFDAGYHGDVALGTRRGVSWRRAGPGPQTEVQCWSHDRHKNAGPAETSLSPAGLMEASQRVKSSTLLLDGLLGLRCMFLDEQSGRLVISTGRSYIILDFA